MLISLGEDLGAVEGSNAFGIHKDGIFLMTTGLFVTQFQWRDPVGLIRMHGRSLSYVQYSDSRDVEKMHCYREYHLGKTMFTIEYNVPKIADKLDAPSEIRYFFPQGSLKDKLKAIFR